MYEIRSEANFSSAHKLIGYDGPCENLHGHNWHVRATVRCTELNDIGIMLTAHQASDAMLNRTRDAFDRLYMDSAHGARILAFGVHPYISGASHRIRYFDARHV